MRGLDVGLVFGSAVLVDLLIGLADPRVRAL
jgi:hypothetical protein